MINKLLPYYGVIMKKTDVHTYPKYRLGEGFSFAPYIPGREDDWCGIQTRAGMTETCREARKIFEQKFKPYPELLAEHCVFIVDSDNHAVAAAALWPGEHFSIEYWRIHWVAVDPDYQGLGLGKVLMTRLMDIFNSENHGEWLYVTSQSWNYCAINIYYHFGFRPYTGKQPMNWYSEDFARCNQMGWELINQWIHTYNQRTPAALCLGDWLFKVSGDEMVIAALKKIFPMAEEDERRPDGKLEFHLGQNQKIVCDGDRMEVFLNKENLHDRNLLRDIGWFYYHVKAAQDGRILVAKSCSEITEGEEGSIRLIFLRKRKYREFDHYPEADGLEQFWEIFYQNSKHYIRDIQYRTCHRLETLEWHVLRRQETTKKTISWQSFQNRMLAIAEEVIAVQQPLMNKGELILHLPRMDDESTEQKRHALVKSLFDHIKPVEVTGISYRGEKDEGNCI